MKEFFQALLDAIVKLFESTIPPEYWSKFCDFCKVFGLECINLIRAVIDLFKGVM